MTDLVDRLRAMERLYDAGKQSDILREAAEEIERLREENEMWMEIKRLREALRDVLETFSMGPLGAAAKHGPDFDLHRAQTDAATKAWRLVDGKPKP